MILTLFWELKLKLKTISNFQSWLFYLIFNHNLLTFFIIKNRTIGE